LYSNVLKMKWDSVNITDKIHYLKELMGNTTGTFDNGHYNIVNALITGSQNTYSGDMGFTIKEHHTSYMKSLWNTAIENQIDDSVVFKIKKNINKF
jgi:hypothetical protein